MIKFLATRGGRSVLGPGLSHGNLERLKKGQPILFHAEQLRVRELLVHEVFVFVGETEDAMRAELETMGALDGCVVITESNREPS